MQFLAGLAFVSTHTSFASTMESAFVACDVNGDGTLSRDEVERSLLAIFPELPPITVHTLSLVDDVAFPTFCHCFCSLYKIR